MADFTNDFWHYWIIAIAGGGMIVLLYMLLKNNVAGSAEPTGHVWDEDLVELNNPLPSWWLWMFIMAIVFAFIYFALYPAMGTYKGMFGWSEVKQWEDEVKAMDEKTAPLYASYMAKSIPELAKDENAVRTGARIFASNCSVCHGSDAGGAKGFPNLRDNDWLHGGTPADIVKTITDGRKGNMPTWRAALGEEGAEEVADYVLSLAGRKHAVGSADAGKAKFAMCAGCHGMDGKGNTMMGAPNLTDHIWLYGGSKKTIMHSILEGRAGVMPNFGEFLGKEKVHVVAAYVYSLSHK